MRFAAEKPGCKRVLGGISPIDPASSATWTPVACCDHVDVIAVHGFPLDWNHWTIHEWPDKLGGNPGGDALPVWVSEVGVSTFGAEEVQEFGLKRTAELLIGKGRPHPLVQSVRSAARLARHHPSPRSGRFVLLPAFLHGPAAGGWHAQAGAATLSRLYARNSASASGSISKITGWMTAVRMAAGSGRQAVCAPG